MARIEFEATLWAGIEGKGWTFVTLPAAASEKLGSRGRIAIRGTINGHDFQTSAFPDGKGSHQFMVNAAMRKGGAVEQGGTARFSIEPESDEVATEVPVDLKKAIGKSKVARALFESITPKARADWVKWVESAKKAETRERRVAEAVRRLEESERPCATVHWDSNKRVSDDPRAASTSEDAVGLGRGHSRRRFVQRAASTSRRSRVDFR